MRRFRLWQQNTVLYAVVTNEKLDKKLMEYFLTNLDPTCVVMLAENFK